MELAEKNPIELVRKKIDFHSSICKFDILDMILRSNDLKEDYKVTDNDLMLLFNEVDIQELVSEFKSIESDRGWIILYIKAIRLGILQTELKQIWIIINGI